MNLSRKGQYQTKQTFFEKLFEILTCESFTVSNFYRTGMSIKEDTLLVREIFMCFEITFIRHLSSHSIPLKIFDIMGIRHYSSHIIPLKRIGIMRMRHFRATVLYIWKYFIRMTSSLWKAIICPEWCLICMILKILR